MNQQFKNKYSKFWNIITLFIFFEKAMNWSCLNLNQQENIK